MRWEKSADFKKDNSHSQHYKSKAVSKRIVGKPMNDYL